MRKYFFTLISLTCILFSNDSSAGIWTRVENSAARQAMPGNSSRFVLYQADESTLKGQLFSLTQTSQPLILDLPLPDGTTRAFKVRYTPMMPEALAARYPELKTFTAVAISDTRVTAKLDFTEYGFHAMIFDRLSESFVDHVDNAGRGYYTAHYRKDELQQGNGGACATASSVTAIKNKPLTLDGSGARTINGYELRTYRLALACVYQYAAAATGLTSPTIPQVLSKMMTTMNRVNGVYERELSITMKFVTNEDTLIWNVASGGPNGDDPFAIFDPKSNLYSSQCSNLNQTVCDTRISTPNYDIGHVFTASEGGFSQVGVVCDPLQKAQSMTGRKTPTGDGFDIDYVAHEMGHEFGGQHTFANGSDKSCGGDNIINEDAFEPGSGSTIMAYAGICSPDDIQLHSDDYFHAISLMEIQTLVNDPLHSCAVKTLSGNKLVALASFQASYSIPYLTPFELSAPTAVDSVEDTPITYCWEQFNACSFPSGERLVNTHDIGPLFRSYKPTTSPTRIFPKDTMVLAGIISNAGIDYNEGEKLPDVARYLTFRLTVRDILNGNGCFLIPNDTVHLDVINTGSGFTVTSQGDSTLVYVGGTSQDVTWNVASTNESPINADNVDIYLSEDGGYTWSQHIGTFPNTGSASFPFPNPGATETAVRIKVKGTGNVFFNVNRYNFTVTHSDNQDTIINVYPSPVHTTVRLSSGNRGPLHFHIFNDIGKLMYDGVVNGLFDIPVNIWPRGMYFVNFVDAKKHKTVKKFVVE